MGETKGDCVAGFVFFDGDARDIIGLVCIVSDAKVDKLLLLFCVLTLL